LMTLSELTTLPLLEGLEPEEGRRLISLFARLEYPAGVEIIRQGTLCESLFLIESGAVVVQTAERGILSRLGPGAWLGEVSMFTGGVASATVTALTEVVVHAAPQTAVVKFLEEAPGFAHHFFRLLSRRLAALSHKAHDSVLT